MSSLQGSRGLDGRVAFITGGARGQGRSHAQALAREGADIVIVDIADQIESVSYALATREDLDETVALVEKEDRRCLAVVADVRDIHAMQGAVDQTMAEFGRIDIVLANAGILHMSKRGAPQSLDEAATDWADGVGVMLTGVYNTLRVTTPPMIEAGRGGAIVITSSTAGLNGMHDGTGGIAAYTASKHGVIGLMRGYAKLLGRHNIRVNTVHPMGVATPMVINPQFEEFYQGGKAMLETQPRLLPIQILEPGDISDAVLWLVSDGARAVTGVTLPVDAGVTTP
jgi:SDR family mycofactocin-dependent oxidoreductase